MAEKTGRLLGNFSVAITAMLMATVLIVIAPRKVKVARKRTFNASICFPQGIPSVRVTSSIYAAWNAVLIFKSWASTADSSLRTSSQFSSQLDSMLGRSLISLLCDLAGVSVKFDILDATCANVWKSHSFPGASFSCVREATCDTATNDELVWSATADTVSVIT